MIIIIIFVTKNGNIYIFNFHFFIYDCLYTLITHFIKKRPWMRKLLLWIICISMSIERTNKLWLGFSFFSKSISFWNAGNLCTVRKMFHLFTQNISFCKKGMQLQSEWIFNVLVCVLLLLLSISNTFFGPVWWWCWLF